MNGRLVGGREVKKKKKREKDVRAVFVLNSLFESWTAIGLSVFSISSVGDFNCLDGALRCSAFRFFFSVCCFLALGSGSWRLGYEDGWRGNGFSSTVLNRSILRCLHLSVDGSDRTLLDQNGNDRMCRFLRSSRHAPQIAREQCTQSTVRTRPLMLLFPPTRHA